MAKNTKNTVVAKKTSTEKAPAEGTVVLVSEAPIAAPSVPSVPLGKLTREEWRALTPEQKAARKLAKKANAPALKARLARTVGKLVRRVERLRSIFEGEDAVTDELAIASVALHGALNGVDALSNDWKPAAGSANATSTPRLNVGDLVDVHPKRRSSFEGLLDANELTGLHVLKVVGKRYVVQSESGTRLTLAVNQIVRSNG